MAEIFSSLRILHLEDSPMDAELIRERLYLIDARLTLDWATNEFEFRKFLNQSQYDLILCDYHLPSFDALSALLVVKAHCPNTPFICVSGAIGEENAVELLKQGTTDYVLKNKLDKLPLSITRALDEVKERKMRIEAEDGLKQSLREKETLLRELYHRTKNNMEVVRGLLVLQAAEYAENCDLQKVVTDTEQRIRSIALVHQILYRGRDLSKIPMKEYISELATSLFRSFGAGKEYVSLELLVDGQFFLLDTAIPFGLILNELISNSMKYAFPNRRTGVISISLSHGEMQTSVLNYSDNGIGVAPGFAFREQTSLGMKLIYSIGEKQLQGTVQMENNNGVHCCLQFSNHLYKARV